MRLTAEQQVLAALLHSARHRSGEAQGGSSMGKGCGARKSTAIVHLAALGKQLCSFPRWCAAYLRPAVIIILPAHASLCILCCPHGFNVGDAPACQRVACHVTLHAIIHMPAKLLACIQACQAPSLQPSLPSTPPPTRPSPTGSAGALPPASVPPAPAASPRSAPAAAAVCAPAGPPVAPPSAPPWHAAQAGAGPGSRASIGSLTPAARGEGGGEGGGGARLEREEVGVR